MTENRPLLMRANRQLGSALVEHNLVKVEDLEAANERVLQLAGQGDYRQASVLGILTCEQKVLREDDVIHCVMEEQGLGIIDLHHYDVPEEVRAHITPGTCWATWTVPYDKEEDCWFVATAYYLSAAVRSHWEKTLPGPVLWHVTSMDVIADFLERRQAELAAPPAAARPGTRVPFPPAAPAKPAT